MSTVALIDDHESVRLGLEAACARDGQTVVFTGSTVGSYLVWRSSTGAPPADVVVLDLTLGTGRRSRRTSCPSSPTAPAW